MLNSFEAERRPVAAEVLKGTDWATRVVTLRSPVLESVRNRLASVLSEFDVVRRRLSRGLSELGVSYRESPIVAEDHASFVHALTHHSLGAARDFGGGPHPGDRVPDVLLAPPEQPGPHRLYEVLRGTRHNLLLFEGDSSTDEVRRNLATIAREVRDRLGRWITPHVVVASANAPESLEWDGPILHDTGGALRDRFGAGADCLYLIRPDGYVGYRCQPADPVKVIAYLGRIFRD